MHGPEVLVPIAFFAMITAIVVGLPYVRGMVRRWDREGAAPQIPSDVSGRLERMERAIEAIALEVERISEGQRFTTKLLSERNNAPALPASARSAE
jgi:transposase